MVDFSDSELRQPLEPHCAKCGVKLNLCHRGACPWRLPNHPFVGTGDCGPVDYTPKPLALGLAGMKHDDDKPRMDLIDPDAISQLAQVLTFGAQKYAAHNWRGGLKQSRLIAALLRHVFAHLRGEDLDPESKLPHIAHAMCCCMFLLGLAKRADLDDRYKDAK